MMNLRQDSEGTDGSLREVRVLIIDDSKPFLRAARRHLEFEPGITVVGEAPDGESGLEEARRLQPDLVLLDVSMPRRSGIDTAADLKALEPPPRVVLLTGHDTEPYREAARRAGVDAMLGKWNLAEDAPSLIRELCGDAAPDGEER